MPWQPAAMITFDVPTDRAVLAAVGEVAIRHEHLNHILRMTIKSLAGLTVEEALQATMYEGSNQLRERVRRLGRRVLGEGAPLLKLQALLANCKRLTEKRNDLVHALWARELDGDAHLRDAFGQMRPVPSVEELLTLAGELAVLTGGINEARLHGWLSEAIERAIRSPGAG